MLKPAACLPAAVSGADALAPAPSRRLDPGGCEGWGAPAGGGARAGSPGRARFAVLGSDALALPAPTGRSPHHLPLPGQELGAPLPLAWPHAGVWLSWAPSWPARVRGACGAAGSSRAAPALARLCFQRSAARPQAGLRLTVRGRVRGGGGQLGLPSTWQNTASVTMATGSPRLKFQCSQCSSLTGLMGDAKLMFDLHAISAALAGLLPPPPHPFPFMEVCTNPSAPPLGGVERRIRAAVHLLPVAYWCAARATALVLPCACVEAKPHLRFWLGTPWSLRAGTDTGLAMPWRHGDGRPGARGSAAAASREDMHGAASPAAASAPCNHSQAHVLLRLLFLCSLESLTLSYQAIRVEYAHLAKLQLEWGSASRARGCRRLGACRGRAPAPWVRSPAVRPSVCVPQRCCCGQGEASAVLPPERGSWLLWQRLPVAPRFRPRVQVQPGRFPPPKNWEHPGAPQRCRQKTRLAPLSS